MTTHLSLGLIPSWQMSMDPAVNYKINPFVQYPPGVYQTTPQPLYPYYQGPELNGLGTVWGQIQRVTRDQINRALANKQQEEFSKNSTGHNTVSGAGPRMVLRGPNMLLGAPQLLGFGTRAALGLSLGLGAVALLGKLFR